jgi:hypothetical protein
MGALGDPKAGKEDENGGNHGGCVHPAPGADLRNVSQNDVSDHGTHERAQGGRRPERHQRAKMVVAANANTLPTRSS